MYVRVSIACTTVYILHCAAYTSCVTLNIVSNKLQTIPRRQNQGTYNGVFMQSLWAIAHFEGFVEVMPPPEFAI
jgi:hypothetical protein